MMQRIKRDDPVKHQKTINKTRWRRTNRVRKNIRGTADRPRLSVHRTNKHIYCQLIDDDLGKTLCSASTRDRDLAAKIGNGGNCDAAKVIGEAMAAKVVAAGVKTVKFDRGPYKFHGRIAELAKAVRDGGVEF